jgi:hypothetical protein
MNLENEYLLLLVIALICGIVFTILGVFTLPTRTESDSIGYTELDYIKAKGVYKVVATYKGQKQVFNVKEEDKEVLDRKNGKIKIEYNPTNDKDVEVFSGEPDYFRGGVEIGLGIVFFLIALYCLTQYVKIKLEQKKEKKQKS